MSSYMKLYKSHNFVAKNMSFDNRANMFVLEIYCFSEGSYFLEITTNRNRNHPMGLLNLVTVYHNKCTKLYFRLFGTGFS
jgi:hypothetical protein